MIPNLSLFEAFEYITNPYALLGFVFLVAIYGLLRISDLHQGLRFSGVFLLSILSLIMAWHVLSGVANDPKKPRAMVLGMHQKITLDSGNEAELLDVHSLAYKKISKMINNITKKIDTSYSGEDDKILTTLHLEAIKDLSKGIAGVMDVEFDSIHSIALDWYEAEDEKSTKNKDPRNKEWLKKVKSYEDTFIEELYDRMEEDNPANLEKYRNKCIDCDSKCGKCKDRRNFRKRFKSFPYAIVRIHNNQKSNQIHEIKSVQVLFSNDRIKDGDDEYSILVMANPDLSDDKGLERPLLEGIQEAIVIRREF